MASVTADDWTDSSGIVLPPRAATRQNNDVRKQFFLCVTDQALCVSTRRRYRLPFRMRPENRLPALSLLPGHSPAQLTEQQVSHVAMESTGVFWIPVWNVLEQCEANFVLTLINPQHVHALPGRKTDRKDGQRIAELMQYGLLKASFIPPPPIRELRDLSRRRAHVQEDRNRVINRIRRLLETANIKLGSVVSDITGKTASLILAAICRGNCTPEELVKLAQASLKNKRTELMASLKGFYSEHFRWLLREAVQDLATLDGKLEPLDRQLAKRLLPYHTCLGVAGALSRSP
jgi:transposase